MSTRLAAGLAGFGLLLSALAYGVVGAVPALAYQGCNSTSTATVSGSSADGGQSVDFTVTVRDCNGNAISGAGVQFAQGAGPAGCTATFSPASATTNASGVATSKVTLPAGCPCQYTLDATTSGVTLTATVRENGCLPFTGAASASTVGSRTVPAAVVLIMVGLAALGAALYLARRPR